jgi:uncharacterized membrane protein
MSSAGKSCIVVNDQQQFCQTGFTKETNMRGIALPNRQQPSALARFRQQGVWWCFFLVCLLYSGYAFYMGALEILFRLGLVMVTPHRAIPLFFVIHALLGGVALLMAPLQLNAYLWQKQRRLHRRLGRIYVVTIWLSSTSGLGLALFFDVTITARIVLGVLAILWFGVTTIAFLRVRQRQIAAHREWMIRSVALSFFFVTFSVWVPGLARSGLPEAISYPLAVFLSWSLNLLVAEWWIPRTRLLISSRCCSTCMAVVTQQDQRSPIAS